MYTPKYITDQLQRDPLVVEHSVKHTVVLKPGFQNRRNQSQYLKNSFPAGFQIRDKLTEKLGSSILQDHKSTGYVNPYGSYTDWTKGERDNTADSISADLTDPYADVAGPYLDEMMRNRNLTQKSVNGPNRHSDVVAIEMRLHNRNEKNPPKNSGHSPQRVRVYNAPALMPTLNPALVQSKVQNNLVQSQASDYDQWLAFQRSDLGDKYWQIKGNMEGYNYSSHDFAGDRSTVNQLMQGVFTDSVDSPPLSAPQPLGHSQSHMRVSLAPITEIPQPLPPVITVQVHTVNHMIRTDKLSEDKHIVRNIDSEITLAQLKALITEEIIAGIERAFQLYPNQTNAQRPQWPPRRDYSKVELNFQCFMPQGGSWRAVTNEVDWIQTKQNCRNEYNVIKLMYALEKKSEFLLLKEIQQSYQKQRDEEKVRESPNISLKALTESIELKMKMKNKYVFNDSPPPSPKRVDSRNTTERSKSTPSLPLAKVLKPVNFLPVGHSMHPKDQPLIDSPILTPPVLSRASSKRSTADLIEALTRTNSFNDSSHRPSGANSLFCDSSVVPSQQSSNMSTVSATQPSRSIFYPKRSDNLDKMYEQLESSIPRQQNFANNLEQRLFKTRW